MTGEVRFVCLSEKKGTPKRAVPEATLVEGFGLAGDAHGGDGHRQVSLLAEEDIHAMRQRGLTLEPGAFGENLVVARLAFSQLGIGSQLQVGEALLEVTQVGKACHRPCAIYYQTGDCIMPRAGLFARVLQGGKVRPGQPVTVTRWVTRSQFTCAVVTVSDRASAGTARDLAGPAVVQQVQEHLGAFVAETRVVADEVPAIQEALRDLAGRGLDLVLTVGGTGLGPRDVTPAATTALLERQVPGLAEAMRAASAQHTPQAWLQRGVAGTLGRTLILNLPGSPRAACENLQVVLPLLPHALALLRGETAHPETDAARGIPV
ncbi:MAG: molybdopterin-binding protein [Thermoanaerobaculum sp.]|nr:molybdopterin-binding protein [Thermoanaerobaculum sp.]